MTEKRYKMVNTNLVDDDGLVYYLIKKDGRDVCQVFGKHTAKAIVTELNALHEENVKLQARNKYLATKIQRERNIHVKEHEKWEEEIQKENEAFKKALVELKEIGDYQEGRIKELNDENEHLEFELEKVVEVCRKYGIYKEELQYVLADYDKMLNENGERAIRYKYCVNSR